MAVIVTEPSTASQIKQRQQESHQFSKRHKGLESKTE